MSHGGITRNDQRRIFRHSKLRKERLNVFPDTLPQVFSPALIGIAHAGDHISAVHSLVVDGGHCPQHFLRLCVHKGRRQRGGADINGNGEARDSMGSLSCRVMILDIRFRADNLFLARG